MPGRLLPLVCCAGLCLVLACGSSEPAPDGAGQQDAAVVTDTSKPPADTLARLESSITDGEVLPWPDAAPQPDLGNVSCTPGEPGMCDDNKNFHCLDGKCTPCPPNYVDCDRRGDCECVGACNGTRCAGGKN